MLRRLAFIAEKETVDKAAAKAAETNGVLLVPIRPEQAWPPGTAAAVAVDKDASAAITAALAAAAQQEELLFLLADSLDSREGLLPGSSRRVADHATRFAAALKLEPGEQVVLERAALLRDLGKIAIPNSVLLKEGLLSYEEWLQIQQHPHLAKDIADKTPALSDIADIIAMHHESFDGDGYPDGLEGNAIPRLARALKILDVYCAMTSPRHYRKGYSSQEDALDYVKSEQGKHFDPDLAEVFLSKKIGKPWDKASLK